MSQACAPASDVTLSAVVAAVSSDRREPGQRCDLLAIERS